MWYSTVRQIKTWQSVYDAVAVEEQYEGLYRPFISELPPVFALDSPLTHWDKNFPEVPRQRHLLRISIYSYLCRIYCRVLWLEHCHIHSLPRYKRDLIFRHRVQLVDAAIALLGSVSQLHTDMGCNQTKYFLISFYTFEPAMMLAMYLLNTGTITGTTSALAAKQRHDETESNPTSYNPVLSTRQTANTIQCRFEIDKALERLDMLREVSLIAELGARKLGQIIKRLDQQSSERESEDGRSEDQPLPNLSNETVHNGIQFRPEEWYLGSGIPTEQIDMPAIFQGNWIDDMLDLRADNDGNPQEIVPHGSIHAGFEV
ncbi:MAG: hypothetical protein Q9199_001585 [Rusavskia elegans]